MTTVADGGAGDDTIYGDRHPNSRIRAGDGDDFVLLQPSPAPADLKAPPRPACARGSPPHRMRAVTIGLLVAGAVGSSVGLSGPA